MPNKQMDSWNNEAGFFTKKKISDLKKVVLQKRKRQCSIKNNKLFPGYYKKRCEYVGILQQ
jgi:hypothetical protein